MNPDIKAEYGQDTKSADIAGATSQGKQSTDR